MAAREGDRVKWGAPLSGRVHRAGMMHLLKSTRLLVLRSLPEMEGQQRVGVTLIRQHAFPAVRMLKHLLSCSPAAALRERLQRPHVMRSLPEMEATSSAGETHSCHPCPHTLPANTHAPAPPHSRCCARCPRWRPSTRWWAPASSCPCLGCRSSRRATRRARRPRRRPGRRRGRRGRSLSEAGAALGACCWCCVR